MVYLILLPDWYLHSKKSTFKSENQTCQNKVTPCACLQIFIQNYEFLANHKNKQFQHQDVGKVTKPKSDKFLVLQDKCSNEQAIETGWLSHFLSVVMLMVIAFFTNPKPLNAARSLLSGKGLLETLIGAQILMN